MNGCGKKRKGDVLSDDISGVAGPRCVRHGALVNRTKCNVDGCGKIKVRNVLSDDEPRKPQSEGGGKGKGKGKWKECAIQ